MVSTWVSILRFIGDMPPPADNPLSNLELVQVRAFEARRPAGKAGPALPALAHAILPSFAPPRQHICNIAITRPNTRDEIYCQVGALASKRLGQGRGPAARGSASAGMAGPLPLTPVSPPRLPRRSCASS